LSAQQLTAKQATKSALEWPSLARSATRGQEEGSRGPVRGC
jgi:hypothetical protein